MKVQYTGRSDIRVLSAADLKKAGVEEGFTKTDFHRLTPMDVTPEVGEALISSPLFGGEFVDVTPAPEGARDPNKLVETVVVEPKGKAKS